MKKTLSLILVAIMLFSVFSVTINAASEKVTPGAVTSVKVAGKGMKVKWEPIEKAVSYILYRYDSKNSTPVAVANVNAAEYVDNSIELTSVNENVDAIKYFYAVAAVMADNSVTEYSFEGETNSCEATCECEKMSTVTQAATVYDKGFSYKVCKYCGYETAKKYTAQLAPKTPVINKMSIKANGIYIKWNLVDGAEEYVVYRKTGNGKWVVIDTVGGNSYIDETVKSGVTYKYTVRGVNSVTRSGYKSSAAVLFLDTPTDLHIANSKNTITFNWEKISGASYYRVYRKAIGDEEYTYLGKGTSYKTKNAAGKEVTRFKYVDTTAEAGVDYLYAVRAANGKTYSAYVKEATVNENSIRRLARPELLKISNQKDGVLVQWSKVVGASEYRVYRQTSSGWKLIGKVTNMKSTAYLVRDDQGDGPVNGKKNTYTVRAFYGSSKSAYNKEGITILRIQEPDLKAIKSTRSGVYVSWDDVAGAKGYYVYSKAPGGKWKCIATVNGGTKNSYTDKTAKKGKTYIYTVKAFNGKTVSSYDKAGLTVKDLY